MNRTYILNKKRVAAVIAVIIGLILTYCTSKEEGDMADIQKGLAEKIIRFHVLANSDSSKDQELKLKVKEKVVEYITPYLEESESVSQSRQILIELTDDIVRVAKDTIMSEGYEYDVTASLKECYFPTKAYGDIVLPPGTYEAYEIQIGESKGQNWWCILYPPLCFVDASCGIVPDSSKEMLRNILDEDEYEIITNATKEHVQYRFKLFELLGLK